MSSESGPSQADMNLDATIRSAVPDWTLSMVTPRNTLPNFYFFKKNGMWHWKLRALGRHETIARSRSEGYSSKSAAEKSTYNALRAMTDAQGKFNDLPNLDFLDDAMGERTRQ